MDPSESRRRSLGHGWSKKCSPERASSDDGITNIDSNELTGAAASRPASPPLSPPLPPPHATEQVKSAIHGAPRREMRATHQFYHQSPPKAETAPRRRVSPP